MRIKRAFTLVEVLMYLSIFSIFSLSMITLSISTGELSSRSNNRLEILRTLVFVDESIDGIISEADSLTCEATTDHQSDRITAQNQGNNKTIEIRNNRLMLLSDSEYDLLPGTIALESFQINPIKNKSGNCVGLELHLTIGSKRLTRVKENFSTIYSQK